MSIDELKVPEKGFTKSERAWLKELVKSIKTVQALQGRNVTISTEVGKGQTISADDCTPC